MVCEISGGFIDSNPLWSAIGITGTMGDQAVTKQQRNLVVDFQWILQFAHAIDLEDKLPHQLGESNGPPV